MEKTHDENRCANCMKSEGVHMDNFTGRPVCFCADAKDGDIVCVNFFEKEGE